MCPLKGSWGQTAKPSSWQGTSHWPLDLSPSTQSPRAETCSGNAAECQHSSLTPRLRLAWWVGWLGWFFPVYFMATPSPHQGNPGTDGIPGAKGSAVSTAPRLSPQDARSGLPHPLSSRSSLLLILTGGSWNSWCPWFPWAPWSSWSPRCNWSSGPQRSDGKSLK